MTKMEAERYRSTGAEISLWLMLIVFTLAIANPLALRLPINSAVDLSEAIGVGLRISGASLALVVFVWLPVFRWIANRSLGPS